MPLSANPAPAEGAPPYHLALDDFPTPAWVSHPDGSPAHFNRAFVDYVGLPLTALLGPDWRQVVHPDDLPAVVARWEDCRRTEEPFVAEYRLRRADGVFRWHLARAAPVRDAGGRLARWVGNCADIDDEARGRETRAQLSAVVESSGDAISSCTLDGTVLTWNPAAERLFGYAAADIVGRSVYVLSPPEELANARAAVAKVLRGEAVPTYETFRLTRAGVPVPVAVTPSPVRGPDGRVTGFAAVYRDITEQRAAAAALVAARATAERGLAQMRAVVSSMAEGLIVADGEGNLLEWNPAALRLHGYETLDEVRRHLSSFATTFALARPDGTPVPFADWPLARLLRGDRVADMEVHLRRLDTGLSGTSATRAPSSGGGTGGSTWPS